MKKLIALLMVVAVVMSMAACSVTDGDGETTAATEPEEVSTSATEEGTEVVTESSTEAEEATESPTEDSTESGEVTDVPTESSNVEEETPAVDPDDIDISNALESTTAESPAKIGEWIKSTRYSSASQEYEVIYWRVIETTFDCQDDIERYNGENHIYEFAPLENDDLAYCKVVYQVYFPEEFSAKEWGISSPTISLYAKNPDGGGIEYKGVAYIGLGQARDITAESEEDLMPGDVFTGEAIYVMVNDPDINYVFEYNHNAEGVDGEMLYDYASYK